MKKPSSTVRARRPGCLQTAAAVCAASPAAVLLLACCIYLATLFADVIVTLLTR